MKVAGRCKVWREGVDADTPYFVERCSREPRSVRGADDAAGAGVGAHKVRQQIDGANAVLGLI